MKWLIIPMFWLLYWGMCILGTGTDKKNLASLRSYPDAVQNIVCERIANAPKEKSISSILLGNIMLFTVVFSVLGLALKSVLAFEGFLPVLWYFFILGEGMGLFDLLVIDLLWWRNTKRIRFTFLQDKALYQDPAKHIGSFVRGIPLFAAAAALSAWIVTLI